MTLDPEIDHLVYAVPDLDAGARAIEARLGITLSAGGRHPDFGTANFLAALSSRCYLEVIGPDPQAEPDHGPRPFGVDPDRPPRLAGWAVRAADLERSCERARATGYDAGPIQSGQRRRPDGGIVRWRLAVPSPPGAGWQLGGDGLVPFLMDWGDTPSPALTAAPGCELVELRAEHTEPASIRAMLAAVGVTLQVDSGPEPALIATLDTPTGRVELR